MSTALEMGRLKNGRFGPNTDFKAMAANRRSMDGAANPNFKNAGWKKCEQCHVEFHSYQPTRKFCCQKCYHASKPKKPPKQLRMVFKKLPRIPKPTVILSEMVPCVQCGESFKRYPSRMRLYCSYACHLASGGAFRAGIASAKAKMKYGAKKDANHNEIFEVLKDAGIPVHDLSAHGCGLPDGIAWIGEAWHLFDVKNPKTSYGKRGLNKTQKKWVDIWKGGPVYLIYTQEEAQLFAAGKFEAVKHVKGSGHGAA